MFGLLVKVEGSSAETRVRFLAIHNLGRKVSLGWKLQILQFFYFLKTWNFNPSFNRTYLTASFRRFAVLAKAVQCVRSKKIQTMVCRMNHCNIAQTHPGVLGSSEFVSVWPSILHQPNLACWAAVSWRLFSPHYTQCAVILNAHCLCSQNLIFRIAFNAAIALRMSQTARRQAAVICMRRMASLATLSTDSMA